MTKYSFQSWTVLNGSNQDVTATYLSNPTSNLVTPFIDQDLTFVANYQLVAPGYTFTLGGPLSGTIGATLQYAFSLKTDSTPLSDTITLLVDGSVVDSTVGSDAILQWNTTGFAQGLHTVKAHAQAINMDTLALTVILSPQPIETGDLTVSLAGFVPNLPVTINADSNSASVSTDVNGNASHIFLALPTGSYTVSLTWTGGTASKSVQLTTSGASITLSPTAPLPLAMIAVAIGGSVILALILLRGTRGKKNS